MKIDTLKTSLPLCDEQLIHGTNGEVEKVIGEIKPEHSEPVCWTLQGNWYRRRDGEQMTGASGRVTTAWKIASCDFCKSLG